MKNNIYLILLVILTFSFENVNGQTYSTSDPPMVYVYNFISNVTINAEEENKRITLSPEVISSMISTEIGKYSQIKI